MFPPSPKSWVIMSEHMQKFDFARLKLSRVYNIDPWGTSGSPEKCL